MPHALAGGRGNTGDIGDHRFGHEAANMRGGRLLVTAADLADHDDPLGLRIALEQLDDVNEIHAADRIAADTDAGALPKAVIGGLKYRLVRQCAGARDDADAAALMNE